MEQQESHKSDVCDELKWEQVALGYKANAGELESRAIIKLVQYSFWRFFDNLKYPTFWITSSVKFEASPLLHP